MSIEQNIPPAALADWFQTPAGRYVLDWEMRQFDNAVDDVFGYYGVQVGLPGIDCLRENRIPLRVKIGRAHV